MPIRIHVIFCNDSMYKIYANKKDEYNNNNTSFVISLCLIYIYIYTFMYVFRCIVLTHFRCPIILACCCMPFK